MNQYLLLTICSPLGIIPINFPHNASKIPSLFHKGLQFILILISIGISISECEICIHQILEWPWNLWVQYVGDICYYCLIFWFRIWELLVYFEQIEGVQLNYDIELLVCRKIQCRILHLTRHCLGGLVEQ